MKKLIFKFTWPIYTNCKYFWLFIVEIRFRRNFSFLLSIKLIFENLNFKIFLFDNNTYQIQNTVCYSSRIFPLIIKFFKKRFAIFKIWLYKIFSAKRFAIFDFYYTSTFNCLNQIIYFKCNMQLSDWQQKIFINKHLSCNFECSLIQIARRAR